MIKSEEQKKQLEDEVVNYLSSHNYRGYKEPFQLECLRDSDAPIHDGIKTLDVILKGVKEGALFQSDEQWEKGLAEVGIKHNVRLNLHYDYYAKLARTNFMFDIY